MRDSEYIVLLLRRRNGTVAGFAAISHEDRYLARYRWHLTAVGYVARNMPRGTRPRAVYLHREVLGLMPGDGLQADHRNRNRLDCRRSNLRVVTNAQNCQNLPSKGGTSQYRGVFWFADRRHWIARVMIDGRSHFVGSFATEDEAGAAASAFRAEHMPFTVEA
jgi:hypothetical protein